MNQPVVFINTQSPEFEQIKKIIRDETRNITLAEAEAEKDIWLTTEEAMEFFKINSSSTLLKRREEKGSPIIYSMPGQDMEIDTKRSGNTLYLKSSLHKYLIWKSNKR